jgi:protein gp37
MAENSKIEWTDHTFNPWIGCQKVSPGCDHCYAETLSNRYGWVQWGPHGERKRTSEANWRKPLQWAKAARGSGRRPRVFCASLADWLDNQVPMDWRFDLWRLINKTPELDWLLLTKRPENYTKLAPWDDDKPPANVWLGTTIEDRERGLRRAWQLAQIPAAVRFWSCEPLLEDLGDLTRMCLFDTSPDGRPAVSWVICGGESGHGARMMQPAWAESIKSQCETAGVSFFMKQMTAKKPIPDHLMRREFPVGHSHLDAERTCD